MNKAFTLIELLIVVAIIGVLTALVIVVINPEQLRREARDVNRKKDLALISSALEQYYADNNVYPNHAAMDVDCLESYLEGGDADLNCDGVGDGGSEPVYINTMPLTQSATATEYCYANDVNAQNYILCAPIEADIAEGPEISGNINACAVGTPSGASGNGVYCIENPF